ncbi:hypothetical protein GCM10009525_13900 [Streptosporangium amethystogenes subsp. fukuiense]
MGADDLNAGLGVELGEPAVIGGDGTGIDGGLLFELPELRPKFQRASGVVCEVRAAAVEERVARVQEQPAVSDVDGDGGVAPGVAWHGNERESVVEPVDLVGAGETTPWLAWAFVERHDGTMGPLDRPVALFLHLVRGDHRGLLFSGGGVHDRARKVGQSADMVKVHMGQHDVSNVIGGVSKRPDLGDCSFGG